MNYSRAGESWSDEEISFLRQYYGVKNLSEIEIELSRPSTAIREICNKLRISAKENKYRCDMEKINSWSETDAAYIAGLIDADGHIGFAKKKTNPTPRLILSMTDEETITWFADKTLSRVYKPKRIDSFKQQYKVAINVRDKIEAIIKRIEPYMITKREQALKALQIYEMKDELREMASEKMSSILPTI